MLSTLVSFWCLHTACTSYTKRDSSGEYYIFNDTINMIIKCDDITFCYFQCDNCTDSTFITNSTAVTINCAQCDFLNVYAQYANHVIMNITATISGYFHLEHAHDINIIYNGVDRSVIYAPYSHSFRLQSYDYNSYNIFNLDYVSNGIYFYCLGNSCRLSSSTIAAFHANNFSFTTVGGSGIDNFIYCPSHDDNVCLIDINSLRHQTLYIANISYDFLPLTITGRDLDPYYYTEFELFCNPNAHGVYQSSTDLVYHSTRDEKCRDLSSTCCYLNNRQERDNIFCADGDSHCVINCAQNNCSNSNIYPANHTTELYVICPGIHDCSNTEIYCPTNVNSVCDIKCPVVSSCTSAIIHSNTNNEYVNLQCLDASSCTYLTLFVDQIETDTNIGPTIHITCEYKTFATCAYALFFVNTEIELFNITCGANQGCENTDIHVEKARKTQINCMGQCALNVYGESHSHNAIQIHCVSKMCSYKSLNIFIEEQYEFDYISLLGDYNYSAFGGEILCSGEKEWPSIYSHSSMNKYKNKYFCDPFRGNWSEIYYCNDHEACDYRLNDTHKIIIYANHTRSLSILCTNGCSQISIFAQYASEVTIHCKEDCDQIKLNANHANSLDIKCESNCAYLMINALYSEQVVIHTESMLSSEINALHNTNLFYLRCNTECNDLDIVLPSHPSSEKTIECNGDEACKEMRVYSDNSNWNDITNLTITSCENTPSHQNWFLFCPSSIPMWVNDHWKRYIPCVYLHNLPQPFCECDRLSDTQLVDYLVNGAIIFDPFGNEECFDHRFESIEWKIFHPIFSITLVVVALCMICVWCVIFTKNFLRKSEEMITIEPTAFVVLIYIYVSDAFIWIIQIYLVVLCWTMRGHYADICASLPVSVCNLHSGCGVNYDGSRCTLPQWPIPLLSEMVLAFLLTSIGFVLLGGYKARADYSWVKDGIPSPATHCVTVFLCGLCIFHDEKTWNGLIKHQYKKRSYEFWHNSKALGIFYLIRYVAFFIPPLWLYFVSIEESEKEIDFNLEWYDIWFIFAVLLLVMLNEFIKQRYQMLSLYDEQKHVHFILTEYCGEGIGLLIASYLGPVGESDVIYQSNSILQPASSTLALAISIDHDSDNEPVDTNFGDIEMEERTELV
eukprot:460265_1